MNKYTDSVSWIQWLFLFFFFTGEEAKAQTRKEVARQCRAGMYSESLSPPGSYSRMDSSASVAC